jgi:hypothetical protein
MVLACKPSEHAIHHVPGLRVSNVSDGLGGLYEENGRVYLMNLENDLHNSLQT